MQNPTQQFRELPLTNINRLASNKYCKKLIQEKEKEKAECLKAAKLELIKAILWTRTERGLSPNGDDFTELYDMDIDQLYTQEIIDQDKYFEAMGKASKVKLNF